MSVFATWHDFFSPSPQECEDKWEHLCALADFSLALTESIQEINKHSFNNFELRIGEWLGEAWRVGHHPAGRPCPSDTPGHPARAALSYQMQQAWCDLHVDRDRVSSGWSGLPLTHRAGSQGRLLAMCSNTSQCQAIAAVLQLFVQHHPHARPGSERWLTSQSSRYRPRLAVPVLDNAFRQKKQASTTGVVRHCAEQG